MSQLTFDGFIGGAPSKTAAAVPGGRSVDEITNGSWYKGRVLSHSSIGMYRACPQRWKLRYIDKVPEKPKSFFSFGKSVHAGLEFLFEKIGEALPTLDDVLSHYKTNWLREGYETGAQEKWFYQEGERILRGFYAKHQADFKKVFQVEFKFTIGIDGVPVTGFIDRIDNAVNGGLAIVDYKTGKAFDKSRVRNDSQMTLYQIACREVFQKPVESVTLYHLNSLTPLTVPAHSKKMEDDLKTIVIETARGISEQKFDPKPDEKGHCQWCDYAQICPAFSGKKFSVGSAALPVDVTDNVDRLGKLDVKITELMAERAEVQQDISTAMRVAGKEELSGRHFVARQEKTDDGPARLSTFPKE